MRVTPEQQEQVHQHLRDAIDRFAEVEQTLAEIICGEIDVGQVEIDAMTEMFADLHSNRAQLVRTLDELRRDDIREDCIELMQALILQCDRTIASTRLALIAATSSRGL